MTTPSSPPKVMVLGPLPPPHGGPETMTAALIGALAGRSDITIRHINTQVSRTLAEKGGKHQLRKSLTGLRQVITLVGAILTFQPRLVYLPLTNSPSFLGFLRDAVLIVLARLLRCRVAVRLHGGYYFYAHVQGWQRWFVRAVMGVVDLAMVQGERLTTAFNGMIRSDRIVAIPNGLDDRPFEDARRTHDETMTRLRKRVLFIGLLCESKGVEDLVHAMSLVRDAEFVLLGEWSSDEFKQRTGELIAAYGLGNRISFPGVLTGLSKYREFISADVFVFPSYFVYEGHAVVSVEALAAGLPIVCTDHGALNESVKDGWNGYFVPARSPEAMADRLNAILNDDVLRASMAANSRKLYTERFTQNRFVDAWVESIRRCAAPLENARR